MKRFTGVVCLFYYSFQLRNGDYKAR